MRNCQDGHNYNLLVEGPSVLSRGLLGGGELRVESETVAIITVDGRAGKTLSPGRHSLGQYPRGSELRAYRISTGPRMMRFLSEDELYVQEVGPGGSTAPVKVNVELNVSYQVRPQNAHRVAFRGSPITELCALIYDAVREEIKYWSFEALRTGGERLGANLVARLRTKVENDLGVTLLRIIPGELTGAVRIIRQEEDRVLIERDPITDGWWIRNNPELYVRRQELETEALMRLRQMDHEQILQASDHNFQLVSRVIEEYIRVGGDLGGILNQTRDPSIRNFLERFMGGSVATSGTPDAGTNAAPGEKPVGKSLTGPSNEAPVSPERIEQEWIALEQAGFVVEGAPGLRGERAIPDGSYNLTVMLPSVRDGAVVVHLNLPAGFEQGRAPERKVTLHGASEDFPPVNEADWRHDHDLVRLVKEVMVYYQE